MNTGVGYEEEPQILLIQMGCFLTLLSRTLTHITWLLLSVLLPWYNAGAPSRRMLDSLGREEPSALQLKREGPLASRGSSLRSSGGAPSFWGPSVVDSARHRGRRFRDGSRPRGRDLGGGEAGRAAVPAGVPARPAPLHPRPDRLPPPPANAQAAEDGGRGRHYVRLLRLKNG